MWLGASGIVLEGDSRRGVAPKPMAMRTSHGVGARPLSGGFHCCLLAMKIRVWLWAIADDWAAAGHDTRVSFALAFSWMLRCPQRSNFARLLMNDSVLSRRNRQARSVRRFVAALRCRG